MEKNKYDFNLYQNVNNIVLGFHGCDKKVADQILSSSENHLKRSENTYDWLGQGIYFWLNDPERAYDWACKTKERKKQEDFEPYVIGAVIDLGLCLNFSEQRSVKLLQKAYENLNEALKVQGINVNAEYKNKCPDEGGFDIIRPLDCAVINYLHDMLKDKGIIFDTVCGYFQEGKEAFEGSGIREKSHIQICVRNTNCIKGYFIPRSK